MREENYVPIDLNTLGRDLPPICDLYIQEHGQFVLYREASLPFSVEDGRRLLSGGVDSLWIRVAAEEEMEPPPRLMAILALPDETLPPHLKAGLLHESVLSIAHRTMASSVAPEDLSTVRELMSVTVEFLTGNRAAFSALLSVINHDKSLYTHAVNVSVYALGLGHLVGAGDAGELCSLGLSAFLHDVGKAKVPSEVLNKPGPLSSEEWAIIRQHPVWGKEAVSAVQDFPEIVATTVGQHHERLDGSGYPDGLVARDLHPFSRIVAIADVYDALTSNRPYRTRRTPYHALLMMRKEMLGTLDPNLFRALVNLLGNTAMFPQRGTPEPSTALL
ncbi:MAG: HD-GYP domain-containing protein [Chloroflexi bacterium]|nr:HD-GYP domain-containing protein [Chloroflexota bacterium]